MYSVKQLKGIWYLFYGDRQLKEAFTNERDAKEIARNRNRQLEDARRTAMTRWA